jgi:hypothetical protein
VRLKLIFQVSCWVANEIFPSCKCGCN